MTVLQPTVPVSEAKLTELVRRAEGDDIVLTRHGRGVAVLVSPDRLQALYDQLDDLEDRLAVHEAPGVTMDFDKLASELGLDA
ncbi:MAG: type II toxin-antitoxin system Phd/YefM family antitoxin [Nocardioidaceae bacterium]